jgi:integrase
MALKVEDVAPHGYTIDRATVRQKKTGRPVKFELTEQTRQAVDDYLAAAGKKPGEFLFTNRRAIGWPMTVRQYARLVSEWIASIGLDPRIYSTHSLRRTKVTLIYRRTGNLRAVQLLLGHTKIESTRMSPTRSLASRCLVRSPCLPKPRRMTATRSSRRRLNAIPGFAMEGVPTML